LPHRRSASFLQLLAGHTEGRGRERRQSLDRDGVAAPLAVTVVALAEAVDGAFHLIDPLDQTLSEITELQRDRLTDSAGDDQADRSVHGGPDKAVYAYAREDIDWWEEISGAELPNGVFGENLTTTGVDVTGAVVGELWRVGTTVLGLAAVAALGVSALGMPTASAAASTTGAASASNLVDSTSTWGPATTATIHPGVVTVTKGASCTANFIYTDAKANTYLGQAAHCSGTGQATETNGCDSASLPLGTPVTIEGSGVTGRLVYNSWLAMKAAGEKNPDACANNDLALIEIPASAVAKVNPSIPIFGGPVGLNTTGTAVGEPVFSYGNSPLRKGISILSPKHGTSFGDAANGWSHTVYTLTPGIPGDSGSAFLDSHGRALGDLSTLALAPQPLSNQVSDPEKDNIQEKNKYTDMAKRKTKMI